MNITFDIITAETKIIIKLLAQTSNLLKPQFIKVLTNSYTWYANISSHAFHSNVNKRFINKNS